MAQNQDPQEHILIALNNETGQMGAVVGQNPDGTPRTADIKIDTDHTVCLLQQAAEPHRGVSRKFHEAG